MLLQWGLLPYNNSKHCGSFLKFSCIYLLSSSPLVTIPTNKLESNPSFGRSFMTVSEGDDVFKRMMSFPFVACLKSDEDSKKEEI